MFWFHLLDELNSGARLIGGAGIALHLAQVAWPVIAAIPCRCSQLRASRRAAACETMRRGVRNPAASHCRETISKSGHAEWCPRIVVMNVDMLGRRVGNDPRRGGVNGYCWRKGPQFLLPDMQQAIANVRAIVPA